MSVHSQVSGTSPSEPSSPEFSPLDITQDLTPLPVYKEVIVSKPTFDGLLSQPVELREDLSSGCGGQTWQAGMVLGKHMLRYHATDLGQERILELGAGGGLVGLAVARGCAIGAPLYITDQLEMFSLMEHNIALNNLEDKVKARILNWGEPLDEEIRSFKPTAILAADCVYFEPAFPLLLRTLADLLELNSDATVYFCFKKRRRADQHFMAKAKKMFVITEAEDEDRSVFGRDKVFLYTIRSKKSAVAGIRG
ncbi:related to putative N2,N2-dimethylguanosine tRNA methyltransferase [Cephalotrichum gorgonifer]|uniref:Protein-lysine N-methyltransferase EFM6 n=1 Tax=Cephalotrichum gorgonifer TaxID=2041049 RepID=A0AAE8N7I4_9PEZI|nr:related to putative N2,N2-dimethylguanosine tRNA methyltransferase [Cephalotrichum gorgonifer]